MKKYLFFILLIMAASVKSEASPCPHKIISHDIWHGFKRTTYEFEGHKAWVVEPSITPKEGNPWTWTMQWADAFVDRTGVLDLIAEGWHHVTIDIFEERGNDQALKVAADFQKFLVDELGLAPRARLVGLSWGGFFSVRYAALYPQNVSKIYLDAPLLMFGDSFCDGIGWWAEHKPDGGEWSSDPRMPRNMASALASEQIPVLLLYGGQDQTVSPEDNCEPFIEDMKACGGNITVHKRDLFGHHPHGVDPGKTSEITNFLAGEPEKNLFTLFDSFGQTGVWQSRLAELSGMNFDAEANFNYLCPLSYGGSCTGLYGPVCGMQRARNLVELSRTKSIDCLILENSNDIGQFSNLGTPDDRPWLWSYSHFVRDSGLKSAEEADEYWKSHFYAIIGSMTPETGAVVRVPFSNDTKACAAEVVSGPAEDGIIKLHNREFMIPIPVKAGMSAKELADYLMKVALRPGCDCIRKSDTGLCYIDYLKGVNTFRFDCGQTGAVIDTEDGTGLTTYDRFYIGEDTSHWSDPGFWTSAPTLYSQWKGFVEYLAEYIPIERMYWFIPTYYMCSPANEAIKGPYYEAQKRFAELYGIKVLDIAAESGINEGNLQDFYNPGDVHPKDSGYRRWGETAYRLLKTLTLSGKSQPEAQNMPAGR